MACEKKLRFLLITSSGGSGHIQAANAKQIEILSNHPNAQIIRRDLFLDWTGKKFGGYCAKKWDKAQKSGNFIELEFCRLAQSTYDYLVFIPVFFSALLLIIREDIDCIVDTQISGTKAIVKALRFIKFWKGKKIYLEKTLTDLPTEEAMHFFGPIRNLSEKDRAYIKLVTTKPLLKKEEDEKSFWHKHCKLPIEQISYGPLPVRLTFAELSHKKRDLKPISLKIELTDLHEVHLISQSISYGPISTQMKRNTIIYTIEPKDKVAILMLGADPHIESLLSYIRSYIEECKKFAYQHRKDHLFVLCSREKEGDTTLLEKFLFLIKQTESYPKNLSIIPLPHQGDHLIAPLFHRSDATFTRSGGLTSMELLTVCQGKIWIHKRESSSRLKLGGKTQKSGMPPWEKGNADYLKEKKGADFITPASFSKVCYSYFSEIY